MRVGVMKSRIKRQLEGMGSLAWVKLGSRTVVEHYGGTLFYHILYGRQHDDRIFEEGELSMSM